MKLKRFHWLAGEINRRGFTAGAEIGAATGNTTSYLMNQCPHLESLVIVDDWRPIPEATTPVWQGEDMKKIFNTKLKGFEDKLIIREGLSWEMAEGVPDGLLDFVFIDASHDYESVKKDFDAWYPKVKRGGMFCGHDLHFAGVRQALKEKFGAYYVATNIDNTWYLIKE